jgi:integrase
MANRGKHEGSIFKRANGRWVAMISLEGGKRKTLYGASRQDAQRKLAAAQRDAEAGLPVISARQTVGQYLAGWLETIEPTMEYPTWKRHREYVELHIAPNIGRLRLRELTAQHIERLYADRLATGLSSTTVNHLHTTLHKALSQAERQGLVARNVTDLVDPPRMAETEIHPLTPQQVRILLSALDGQRLEALYVVALATGMRQSELLGLRWADVDLDARPMGLIRVRAQLSRVKGVWTWKEPKTKRSRRQIALPASVVETLRRHRVRQHEERLRLGAAWQDHDLVFCTGVGGPLQGTYTLRLLVKFLEAAGLPRIRFHDLRHTAATLLLSARVNPKVVSEMLGHATVAITLDIYSHVLPDMQQDAAVAMGTLLYG